jgi:hypothetical protein
MSTKTLIKVNPLDVTSVYTKNICNKTEGVEFGPSGSTLEFTENGEVNWTVFSEMEGAFKVYLCSSTNSTEITCFITANEEQAVGNPLPVEGFFEGHPLMNFEMIETSGSIMLLPGENLIRLRMQGANLEKQVHLSSIELLPIEAKSEICKQYEQARLQRASTDWLVNTKYGIMFHWTSQSEPRYGARKPYTEAVEEFDVESFVKIVDETGAGYVLFTLNHAEPHCPAPICSWEAVHPGWTTRRDLIREIGEALKVKGIRLMIYIASHTLGKLFQVNREEYLEYHQNVLREIGGRYGELIAGYWFDGWYQAYERFGHFPIEKVYEATKIGNKDRLVAFNFWIFPSTVPWQEYWAGEVASPGKKAVQRTMVEGAGKGLQYQALLIMDAPWVHGEPRREMADPRFTADELNHYINKCSEKEGVVTINLGIYQDGTIGKKTLEVMRQLKILQNY